MLIMDVDNIIPYLLERGFLDNKSIVAGDLFVIDKSRRNRMIRIIRRRDTSYLVKQPRIADDRSKATFIVEAQVYDLLSNNKESPYVKDISPQYFWLDEQNNILIIEFMPYFQILNQLIYEHPQKEYHIAVGKSLGNMLSVLHNAFRKNVGDDEEPLCLPKKCPSFVSFLSRP